ncbi:MAG: hypothetical protein GXP62_13645 [Oligoflexia bacterium]|nr:hypothetical protein [Oligoflexia bacterium]
MLPLARSVVLSLPLWVITSGVSLAEAPAAAAAAAAFAVRPATFGISLEPPEAVVRFREDHLAAGAPAAASQMACRPFAEGLLLCFTVGTGDARRTVTAGDLSAWSLGLPELERLASARALGSLGPTRPELTQVVDMDATYWLSMEGDSLDMASFLDPTALAARCAGELRVAAPARDIFMAWCGGSTDLDMVLAVGVARINEASEHPVGAAAYRWDDTVPGWVVWGRARH